MYLAAAGLLKLYDIGLDGAVAASAAALISDRHWMYWLAAQTTAGRNAELGYLALAGLYRGRSDFGSHRREPRR